MPVNPISVVIICKNAASTIGKAITSAFKISNDVVVVDSGSSDGTLDIISSAKVRLIKTGWLGYGPTKNLGNTAALHNWIFSLDADEFIDDELAEAVNDAKLVDNKVLYFMRRLNYLGEKPILFGEWRNDWVTRLFNKTNAGWDASAVHEELLVKEGGLKVRLKGKLHHFTSTGILAYQQKLEHYARLNADKYYRKGKSSNGLKLYLSPAVNFIQNYLIKAGFLDGKAGWQIARAHAGYTYNKYRILRQKQKNSATGL